MDSPLFVIILFIASLYLLKLWIDDLNAANKGQPNPKALPGARSCSKAWIILSVVGAILITIFETAGEIALGVSAEQSDIASIYLLAMIGAGIIEEIFFRGFLVIKNRGRTILIGSIILFSLLFSLGHFQYYTQATDTGGLFGYKFNFEAKSLWTLLILFINSLWFYAVRFLPANPTQSMLPCFAAHISSNLSVFIIKAIQGHVTLL